MSRTMAEEEMWRLRQPESDAGVEEVERWRRLGLCAIESFSRGRTRNGIVAIAHNYFVLKNFMNPFVFVH